MEFQIDINAEDRTAEQNALLERYYQAAKILKAAGFNAKVSLCIITRPTDNPASRELK
jgi:hypothetical protein